MIRLMRRGAPKFAPATVSFVLISFLFAFVACTPADPLEEIEKLQAQGKLEESLDGLRELIKADPGNGELLFMYGRTLSSTGRASLAEWSLREALKYPDWKVSAALQLAADAARSHNYPAAIEMATLVLDEMPDNLDALYIRATASTYSRLYHEEALADVARIEEIDPVNLEVMEPKILALIGLERFDEVETAMEELGRKLDENRGDQPDSGWFCTTISIFAWERGENELARERWEKCLADFPSDPEVVTKSMQFFDSQRDYERGLEIVQNALELAPDARVFRQAVSARLTGFGRLEEAEQVLLGGTEVERIRPRVAAWLDLARFYQTQERYDEAADAVGKAVEIVELMSTPESQMLLDYADALLIAGRYERALEVADQMTYRPHQEMIRARIAQEQGEYEKALEHFETAFALWPDNPFARYYAALAAEAVGDFDRAIEQYRYSIRIAPGATDSRIRVARIHQAQRRYGEALQLLRIRAADEPLAPEGELLSMRLWARVGRGWEIDRNLETIRNGAPSYIGRALAASAEGVADRAGALQALAMLRRAADLKPTDLNYAEALRSIVEYAHASGQGVDRAMADLEAAMTAHPDSPEVREIAAYAAELEGRPQNEVQAAYEAVLEVDPENGRALEGLGRAASRVGDHERAIEYFQRAAAALEGEAGPSVRAAEALVALGRVAEAEALVDELMKEHQFDWEAAGLLAELRFERGDSGDRTLDLARRAIRFGGAEPALNLLLRIHESRGESEEAKRIGERWKAHQEAAADSA